MRFNGHSHLADLDEELGEGNWTYDQYLAMDAKFTAALEGAFVAGFESRASAASQIKLPATLGPRFVAPPLPDGLWRSAASDATCFVARG